MIKVYLNYPVPHLTIHGDPTCGEIGKMRKLGQREVLVTAETFTTALASLEELPLAANASSNDLWLTVDFDDQQFEQDLVSYMHRLLGLRYKPLRGATVTTHCSKRPAI